MTPRARHHHHHHEPRIALVTTCKGRVAHLAQTLPQNLKDNAGYRNAVFVIVSYGDGADTVRYLKEHHMADMESGRVVLYHVLGVERFKMAHAKNVAHRCGIAEGAEILVNVDADNFTGLHFAQWLGDLFRREEDVYAWGCMIKGKMDRGISGRIAVRAQDFLKAGGYDECYEHWGPDDKDFNMRLRLLGLDGVEIPARFLSALRHTDRMRFKEYPGAVGTPYETEEIKERVDPQDPIANYGDFGCCQLTRNLDPVFLQLRKVPTRVFGIGLHKTGTTSLDHALSILGLDSAHWPSARWAKTVFKQMREDGRSRLLECSYAACDLPIPLFYKQLDEAYPGSKFILTIRPDTDWLTSVERHFQDEYNPYRRQWNTDWATHQLHNALYGRKSFDRNIFMERYYRHNMEVMRYFANRPQDLLIFPTHHARWESLCPFLGQPLPDEPYPHLNATRVSPSSANGEVK